MRLVACALSAVLLSGCSWYGMNGSQGDVYGYDNYGYGNYGYTSHGQNSFAQGGFSQNQYAAQTAYGANAGAVYGRGCGQAQTVVTQQYTQNYVPAPAPSPCVAGNGYSVAQNGSMTYGGAASGQSTMYASGTTTLSNAAPYGAAAGGTVQTVQGAPIYVGQPYVAQDASSSYGYQASGLRGSSYGAEICCESGGYYNGGGYYGGGKAPFGLEAAIGTEIGLSGDVFGGEISKPFLGGPGMVSELGAVKYKDAYKNAVSYELAGTYDLNQNTTVMAQIGYSKAKGQKNKIGTVDDGCNCAEDLYAEFSDLEQFRVEGGLRHYMGGNATMRPYVGATAGFTNLKDVTLTQSSETLVDPNLFVQNYIRGGWYPTVAGTVGAEWQVGPRSAIGVESGIRWTEAFETNLSSGSQLSVPLKLRGRLSF